mmetsp:Transcript_15510/g.29260  ORF Transcript_15510/g.29260 Transcript_15510/m.29260 type:complete len:713 (-) Transcript_15510:33-2171(-)
MSLLLSNVFNRISSSFKCSNSVTHRVSYYYYHHHNSSLRRQSSASASSLLKILPEVSEALSLGKPVVALESTILAHGLPPPENIQLARDISKIIRSRGAVPATIAVKDGICRVGLTIEELSDLALSGVEKRASKCSTRELPLILAKHHSLLESNTPSSSPSQWGATTVASTMRLAHMAGISTFVTGGTGGVHRGAESSMDISADLMELARTPVLVVSAGVKSILDIQRTLETLETNGVPTVAFGADDFPAFFSPSSGVLAPARVDSAHEVARAYLTSLNLGLPNGMLVAVPNNNPAGASVEAAIQETLDEANKLGITGRDVTPFILKKVTEKTKGDSLKSNISLVKNNAAVGADIAVAIANARKGWNTKVFLGSTAALTLPGIQKVSQSTASNQMQDAPRSNATSRVVVMGGAVIDLVAKPAPGQELILATSNPGMCYESDGGVGRNIAEVLGRLGSKPILFSAVGKDSRGLSLLNRMEDEYDICRERQHIEVVNGVNTATYLAVLDSSGDLHTAIADMGVLSKIKIPDEGTLSNADYLIVDANAPIESLVEAAKNARWAATKVCFEPTSVPKAAVVSKNNQFMSSLTYAFPNVDELSAMSGLSNLVSDELIKSAAKIVLNRMNPTESHLIITMGAKGVILASKYEVKPIIFKRFEASAIQSNNCTGAGDTLVGAFVHALLNGHNKEEAVKIGMEKAILSIQCEDRAISPMI